MTILEEVLLVYFLALVFFILLRYINRPSSRRMTWLFNGMAVFLALGAVILIDAFIIEPNWIETTKITIHDRTLATATGGDSCLTIVQLSDLHVREGLRFRERQIINKVNVLKPDLILITGDVFEQRSELQTAAYVLSKLKSRMGVYAVLGNTDYRKLKQKELRDFFESVGVTLLINDKKQIIHRGGSFWLVGLDDPVHKRDDLRKALSDIPNGEPVILMSHSPDVYIQAILAKVNLVVTGHTHGGQVGIPFLVKMSRYANRSQYLSGLFSQGNTIMYVNRGIGTKNLPIRFSCRPEITQLVFTGQ